MKFIKIHKDLYINVNYITNAYINYHTKKPTIEFLRACNNESLSIERVEIGWRLFKKIIKGVD